MSNEKSEPSPQAMQAAQDLIDAGDKFAYDVCANHGQIFDDVKHMHWLVKAVAEELEAKGMVSYEPTHDDAPGEEDGNRRTSLKSAAQKTAATHVLYDAGPTEYVVLLMEGDQILDEYRAGNHPHDSVQSIPFDSPGAVGFGQLLEYAQKTAEELAAERGIPGKISRDEDLCAEERGDAPLGDGSMS